MLTIFNGSEMVFVVKMKRILCLLLVLAMVLSLCACGASVNDPTESSGSETPTEPSETETPTDPTQAPTDPVETEDAVGIYRCMSIRLAGEADYQESPGGYGLEVYEDGTAMIYVADCVFDLEWNLQGNQFSATTMDASNIPMNGTIDGDNLEVTFDGMDLCFQKKTQQELADEAVEFLRTMMADPPQQFAVAYLGWMELGEDLQNWLEQKCPLLVSSEPYIPQIPQERVFGTSGEVYCIVPNDPNMQVTIKRLQDAPNVEDMVKEVLFEGSMGEPFLVIANSGDFYQDTQIIFTDSQGTQTLWYPMTGQYYTTNLPENDEGSELAYDFSYYSEVYPYGYNLWMRDGWDWLTEDYLTKTCWNRYFERVEGDVYAGYTWAMNLSEDGTVRVDLIDDAAMETLAFYTGTWQLTELDEYNGLLLNMTCDQNNAPMEIPDVIAEEYVVLRAPDVDNLLLGIRDGQASNLMVTEEDHYCSVWFGAVG